MSGPVRLTRDDVRALVARIGDSTTPSSEVYRIYREMMAVQGREPASLRMVSRSLRGARQRPLIKQIQGKKVKHWVLRVDGVEWLYPED